MNDNQIWEYLTSEHGQNALRTEPWTTFLNTDTGYDWKRNFLKAHATEVRINGQNEPAPGGKRAVKRQASSTLKELRRSSSQRSAASFNEAGDAAPWASWVGIAKQTLTDSNMDIMTNSKSKAVGIERLSPVALAEKVRVLKSESAEENSGLLQALFDVHAEYYAYWAYVAYQAYGTAPEASYPWLPSDDDENCTRTFGLLGSSLPLEIFSGLADGSKWWRQRADIEVLQSFFGCHADLDAIAIVFDLMPSLFAIGVCPTLHLTDHIYDHPVFHPEWKDSLAYLSGWLRSEQLKGDFGHQTSSAAG